MSRTERLICWLMGWPAEIAVILGPLALVVGLYIWCRP